MNRVNCAFYLASNARLSDLRGELSEDQKRELEGNRDRAIDLEEQVTHLRSQLTSVNNSSDTQVLFVYLSTAGSC